MGQARVAKGTDTRDVIERTGEDPALAKFDPDRLVLAHPNVTDAVLAATIAGVENRTANAGAQDKRNKETEIRAAALQRHTDAVLAADTTYQAQLTDVVNAVTLADLDAITP